MNYYIIRELAVKPCEIFKTIASQIMSYIWDKGIEVYTILEGSCKGLFGLVGIERGCKGLKRIKSLTSQSHPLYLFSPSIPHEGMNQTRPNIIIISVMECNTSFST
jgi:hypothetical protein